MTFRTILDGLHMPECPRWHEGALWLTDMWGHKVLRLADGVDAADRAGGAQVVATFPDDEEPGGIGWLPDGRLLVVGMLGRKVYVVDGGTIAVHSDLSELNRHLLNDMIVADDGTAYVSGFGWNLWEGGQVTPSPVLRVRPDGSAEAATEPLAAPNGMILSADGATFVVAEPAGGCLSRYTVTPDGDLVDRTVVPLEKAPGAQWVAPDGICLDAEDHVWAADPVGGRVFRAAPDGTTVDQLAVEGGPALACVLAGPERRTLFVAVGATTHKKDRPAEPGGRLIATEVDVPGAGKP
jgi:sugar lactone lactonase YvrE